LPRLTTIVTIGHPHLNTIVDVAIITMETETTRTTAGVAPRWMTP
jgi:hypothetical protein